MDEPDHVPPTKKELEAINDVADRLRISGMEAAPASATAWIYRFSTEFQTSRLITEIHRLRGVLDDAMECSEFDCGCSFCAYIDAATPKTVNRSAEPIKVSQAAWDKAMEGMG